jgi:hypothetical protein
LLANGKKLLEGVIACDPGVQDENIDQFGRYNICRDGPLREPIQDGGGQEALAKFDRYIIQSLLGFPGVYETRVSGGFTRGQSCWISLL